MGNGERVQIPDGTYEVQACTKSTGPFGYCLQLDIDGRPGLSPLMVEDPVDIGATVTVADNDVVDVGGVEE